MSPYPPDASFKKQRALEAFQRDRAQFRQSIEALKRLADANERQRLDHILANIGVL